MKLLITGGAGFLGSNFIHFLLDKRKNYHVTCFDSLSYAGNLANLDGILDRITFVQGNILDEDALEAAVLDCDAVVHFAAETHNDNSIVSPDPFIQTNIVGTVKILEACRKNNVRLHHVSTDEVFGDLPMWSKERFSLESPYKPSSPYSASKASSDLLVRAWIRTYGIHATISNCTNVYGPRQHEEKLIPMTIKNLLAGKPPKIFGFGDNVRDWIHVDDHSFAVLLIIEKGKTGNTYLISAEQERRNIDIVKALIEIIEPNIAPEFVEDRPGHDFRYALDPSKIKSELGWKPQRGDIESELPSVVDFYKLRFES